MDIHKPKPVHNLRQFLSEIAVIVIGVAIALAIQQRAERLSWQPAATPPLPAPSAAR